MGKLAVALPALIGPMAAAIMLVGIVDTHGVVPVYLLCV
jgi:hypothetical protein